MLWLHLVLIVDSKHSYGECLLIHQPFSSIQKLLLLLCTVKEVPMHTEFEQCMHRLIHDSMGKEKW